MATGALGTCHCLHRSRAAMFLMAFGTAVLNGIELVEAVRPFAESGVADLATIIDLFDAAGGSAFSKTFFHNLEESARG